MIFKMDRRKRKSDKKLIRNMSLNRNVQSAQELRLRTSCWVVRSLNKLWTQSKTLILIFPEQMAQVSLFQSLFRFWQAVVVSRWPLLQGCFRVFLYFRM